MRGSIPSRSFLNVPPSSPCTTPRVSQTRHYATESPKGDPKHKNPWIHSIAQVLSSWISSQQTHRDQRLRAINPNARWAHYFALGLWRNASQEDIKKRYYELSRKHHPDVSQDPDSPEIFRRATEAYAVLGKKKTRRTYDQQEQLHSALITTLKIDKLGASSTSTPRPVDPTFWDPIRMGSSTFYRPPPGYWTIMNKLKREREKSDSQEASSPTNTPSRDKTKGDEAKDRGKLLPPILLIILGLVLDSDRVKDLLERKRMREINENERSALQEEGSIS